MSLLARPFPAALTAVALAAASCSYATAGRDCRRCSRRAAHRAAALEQDRERATELLQKGRHAGKRCDRLLVELAKSDEHYKVRLEALEVLGDLESSWLVPTAEQTRTRW